MSLIDSQYEELRSDYNQAGSYSEKISVFIKHGVDNLTIYKSNLTNERGSLIQSIASWRLQRRSLTTEQIEEATALNKTLQEYVKDLQNVQFTTIEPKNPDELEILVSMTEQLMNQENQPLLYAQLMNKYDSSVKTSPIPKLAINAELQMVNIVKLNYENGKIGRKELLSYVHEVDSNDQTPAPDYAYELFKEGYESKLLNRSRDYDKIFKMLYRGRYGFLGAFKLPVTILRHYFIGESILQYEAFLTDQLNATTMQKESQSNKAGDNKDEQRGKVKLRWTGGNDALYDLFAQLTIMNNREGTTTLLPDTLDDIAYFINQSFEGMPSTNTIKASLSKFRGSNRPKRFRLDVRKG
ncbi:hypothetical protein [Rudanella lutea]|uniref:hypothetical protein n=1 Tax=Rudanella lutea TaxID=451374 RepID=UPI000368658E|nr:hypothetical protein [Rudanella lutea]